MKLNTIILFLFLGISSIGQNTFRAVVRDKSTNENLIGAIAQLKGTTNGTSSDKTGELLLTNIPDSVQIITFSLIGYVSNSDTVTFPFTQQRIILLYGKFQESSIFPILSTMRSTGSNKTEDFVNCQNKAIHEAAATDALRKIIAWASEIASP